MRRLAQGADPTFHTHTQINQSISQFRVNICNNNNNKLSFSDKNTANQYYLNNLCLSNWRPGHMFAVVGSSSRDGSCERKDALMRASLANVALKCLNFEFCLILPG
ncbi:hypothetical protein BpHYR1_015026 [Brachionus plicatilis]|uniref:Uncharacterized protein n=1 Tax=Brachionus plicatilis TaxID=10195 RepID=A0A3M7RIN3_BRAPC|nr:hypothetical protein BpHYR1_015026 [Brachionus plicatilis]